MDFRPPILVPSLIIATARDGSSTGERPVSRHPGSQDHRKNALHSSESVLTRLFYLNKPVLFVCFATAHLV
jgi:hypothetical protein